MDARRLAPLDVTLRGSTIRAVRSRLAWLRFHFRDREQLAGSGFPGMSLELLQFVVDALADRHWR